jgi:hypothetical protein
MTRALAALVAAAVLGLLPAPGADEPRPAPDSGLPVGRWRVEFANGVAQVCDVREDGTAWVTEPQRSAEGKAAVRGGAVVLVFADDRTERWAPVGKRFVVEHWFPASALPTVPPVLGIAERTQ